MYPHEKYEIKWIGFPESKLKNNPKVRGVYLLGDFYIGASKNIRSRVVDHLKMADSPFNTTNKTKKKIIEWYNAKRSLTVTFIDDDPFNERKYANSLPNLTNSCYGRFYDEMYINPNPLKNVE